MSEPLYSQGDNIQWNRNADTTKTNIMSGTIIDSGIYRTHEIDGEFIYWVKNHTEVPCTLKGSNIIGKM
jgi:hypothetical protein